MKKLLSQRQKKKLLSRTGIDSLGLFGQSINLKMTFQTYLVKGFERMIWAQLIVQKVELRKIFCSVVVLAGFDR